MAGIVRRSFDEPDESFQTADGSQTDVVGVGDFFITRSVLLPGWSWEKYIGPDAGEPSCPMEHREYVVSGRIRYRMDDGSEVVGEAGDYLEIEPGHLAWVLGDVPCVTIDW